MPAFACYLVKHLFAISPGLPLTDCTTVGSGGAARCDIILMRNKLKLNISTLDKHHLPGALHLHFRSNLLSVSYT